MNPLLMIVIMAFVLAQLQGCALYAYGLRESSTQEFQQRQRQSERDATYRDIRRILKEYRK